MRSWACILAFFALAALVTGNPVSENAKADVDELENDRKLFLFILSNEV